MSEAVIYVVNPNSGFTNIRDTECQVCSAPQRKCDTYRMLRGEVGVLASEALAVGTSGVRTRVLEGGVTDLGGALMREVTLWVDRSTNGYGLFIAVLKYRIFFARLRTCHRSTGYGPVSSLADAGVAL